MLEALADPRVATALLDTLAVAVAVALLAVTAGTAAALATERMALPGRWWLRAGLLLPLLCPPFVTAFGWTRAYGPRGLADLAAGLALPGLYGPAGIVLVLTVAATPLVWLIVAAALAARVEPDLERAARAAGAGPIRTLATVTLPLLRPALISAGVVSFIYAINAFGVPAVLGTSAGFTTVTTLLYQDLARSSDPAMFAQAAFLAATLVVLALLVVGPTDRWLTGRPARRTGDTAGHDATSGARPGRLGWAVAVTLGGAILITAVIPLSAVVTTALTRAVGLAPIPANWTLDNLAAALSPRSMDGLVHSLGLATVAATIVVVLGTLLATTGGAGRNGPLRTSAALGFAVPGSALAIAVLLAYGGRLRDSLLIILIAYLAKFWALGHRQIAGSMDRIAQDLVRAARVSGADPWTAVRTVAVPVLRPSLVAAWLVVFLFATHELTMSSLLHGPGTTTLAVVVLDAQQLGDPTITAALAVLLVGIVAMVALPLAVVSRRPR